MDGIDPLDPGRLQDADFPTVRRGYDQEQVKGRLGEAADEIRRLNALVGELSRRIVEFEATPPAELEANRVTEALGDEVARLLQTARDTAQERIERAGVECDEMITTAKAAAAAIVEEGRDQGREVVHEARTVRERMLADLARKRKLHRAEVEQLRAMRDRLLESFSICQQGLREWIDELVQVVPQAIAAAERAGLIVAAEPEPTVGQIEAEIVAARLVGLPMDEEVEPEPDMVDEPSAERGEASEDADAEEDEEFVQSDFLGPVTPLRGTPAAGAPVGLYDVEAEADTDLSFYVPQAAEEDEPVEVEAEGFEGVDVDAAEFELEEFESPEAVEIERSELAQEAQSEESEKPSGAEAPAPADAEAIFARLRAVGQDRAPAPAEPAAEAPATEPEAPAEPDVPDDGLDGFVTLGEFAAGAVEQAPAPASPADEPAPAPDPEESEPSEEDNLIGAARAVAVGEISRRLKRMVVDEQGEVLDATRRMGARALDVTINADVRPYARVVREPLEDFASDIDVSIDDMDLKAAAGAVVSVLVEPVRARLGELMDEDAEADELSDEIRAVYRESRSRRAVAAAEAAFNAGWAEPVS